MEYRFTQIDTCNMCGAPTSNASVLGKRMNRSQGFRPVSRAGITTTVMKCRNCELIFSNPMPVPADLAQHYGVPPESYWTPQYFVLSESYFSRQIDRYLKLSGQASGAGQRALDIGAGVGKCMKALMRAGFDAYGLEPSEPFYQRALTKMAIPSDRLQHATLEGAEYPEATFDFVTFGAVLEHLYDPSASIERAMRWTKPGGLVHVEVPSSKWLTNKIANLAYAIQGLDYVANISPMHNPFHLYEFDLKSFDKNAARLGYEVAYHEYRVSTTYLPRVLDVVVKPLMAATDSGKQLEIWLRRLK